VIASTEVYNIDDAVKIRRQEQKRRELLLAAIPSDDPLINALTLSADQFLVRRNDDWSIIAGYPWFTDWGRDTMISLPGLTLFTGKAAIAKSILSNFARHTDMGMIPNRFLDSGDGAEFNSVDGTLWFFEAVRAYAAVTGDYDFVLNEIYPVLEQIIGFHIRGTRYNIKMSDNGLLTSGAPGVQLTWMDAKIGNWVVTPRAGKPVEIQALWYNALKTMEDLARRIGDERQRKRYAALSTLALWTFNRIFWSKEQNCLYDVVNGAFDASIRPNQILAVSLYHSMLSLDRACAVVEAVERELLTPVGLRTLSPSHPDYRGFYRGDQAGRDSAYHQGTVWPWLLGAYLTAVIRVRGGDAEARKRARRLLQGLEHHLAEAGLGQISEIFDGDFPHQSCGCFAQAWSVAELLRALRQDTLPPLAVNGSVNQTQRSLATL
jgi:predicted glycogen debranching enzyme